MHLDTIGATPERAYAAEPAMFRLAGYQVFCWLALAFMTLSGTSSRAAFVVIGVGLAATGLGVVIQLAAIRRVTTPRRQT